MNIRLVCYSDQNMSISRKKCIESALLHGVTDVHEWDREMIEATEFYQMNREILDQERGSGYWLFKPYIIYKSMLDMADGDILVYSDAGVEFINSVHHIINVMDQDLFLFGNNYNHVDWSKQDAIDKMRVVCTTETKQVQASVIFIKVTDFSKRFIKEWMLWCQMPNLIDDSPSLQPNRLTFADHRHDQTLLTNLAINYKLLIHYWPAQYNNGAFTYDKIEQYKNDKYPIIFHHTRKRNHEH